MVNENKSFVEREINKINIVLFLLVLSSFVFHFFNYINSEKGIVEQSDFNYEVFIFSRIVFQVPIAFFIVSLFENKTYKDYLMWSLLFLLLPLQIIYSSIQESIIYLCSLMDMKIYFSEQYVRLIVTLIAWLGLAIIYIKKRKLKILFLLIGSTVYIGLNFMSHILLIENWWASNLDEQTKKVIYLTEVKDRTTFWEICRFEKYLCFDNEYKKVEGNSKFNIKLWQTENLKKVIENKNKLKEFYFFTDTNILLFSNDVVFSKKEFEFRELTEIRTPIRLIFAQNKENKDLFILNTKITEDMNNLRLYYGIFSMLSGIVWLFGVIFLLRVHQNVKKNNILK